LPFLATDLLRTWLRSAFASLDFDAPDPASHAQPEGLLNLH
jgi:hypothetical protein